MPEVQGLGGPEGPSASKVFLTPTARGAVHLPGVNPDSVIAVERLLQENHDKHHMYFNNSGFHNHIVHHTLALYALGATPEALQAAYDYNKGYQRPRSEPKKEILTDLSDVNKWPEYLGKREHFSSFLAYFTKEIEELGIEGAILKWLFGGSARSEDLFVRMFAGFVHPFIHLGYGVEFGIAAVVAEALAQAATHDNWIGDYLLPAEKKAKERANEESRIQGDDHEDFVALRFAVSKNPKLSKAAEWSDDNKIQGLLERASKEMIEVGGRVLVPQDLLQEKVKESVNLSAQLCGGAIKKDKKIMFDFYLMHSMNSSLFLPVLVNQSWIPVEAKVRLVEWKVRYDLILYASRRAPEIHLDEIEDYIPKVKGEANPWLNIIERGLKVQDDGHTIKMLRAILNGEEMAHGEVRDGMMTGKMWRNYAAMVIDSVEGSEDLWIRSAGFDEAWKDIPARKNN